MRSVSSIDPALISADKMSETDIKAMKIDVEDQIGEALMQLERLLEMRMMLNNYIRPTISDRRAAVQAQTKKEKK